MKVGDIVRCSDSNLTWANGIDAGVGIIISVEKYDIDSLSIHTQWVMSDLWYEEKDLEIISDI